MASFILSMKEAADLLKVHISTVWRWDQSGVRGHKLPTVVVGGRRFVVRDDLMAFLAKIQTRQEPTDRTKAAARILDGLGVVERGPTGEDTDRKAKA